MPCRASTVSFHPPIAGAWSISSGRGPPPSCHKILEPRSLTASSMSQMPDFAFETSAGQSTLSETLRAGVALLVLFDANGARGRLQRIAAMRLQLASAGVQPIAVGLGARSSTLSDKQGM